jgi:hypothetical protein
VLVVAEAGRVVAVAGRVGAGEAGMPLKKASSALAVLADEADDDDDAGPDRVPCCCCCGVLSDVARTMAGAGVLEAGMSNSASSPPELGRAGAAWLTEAEEARDVGATEAGEGRAGAFMKSGSKRSAGLAVARGFAVTDDADDDDDDEGVDGAVALEGTGGFVSDDAEAVDGGDEEDDDDEDDEEEGVGGATLSGTNPSAALK